MFNPVGVMAVISASDLGRARRFYSEKLGLEPSEVMDEEEAVVYTVNGTSLLLYRSAFAGTAKSTVLAFEVADLKAEMAELRSRGVEFAEYDFPGLKTENGIATIEGEMTAWFTDTEGNIVSVSQRT